VLKIRLRRMGARNRPYYRIVVSDSRLTARAEVLEELGSYDPVPNPPALSIDRERARHWIGLGAAVSPTVRSLIERPEGSTVSTAPKKKGEAAKAPASA
jgi:small subunit ribosomal protein S16